MTTLSKSSILKALSHVTLESDSEDIVSSNRVSAIIIKDKAVGFSLDFPEELKDQASNIQQQCEEAVFGLGNVDKVTVVLTSHSSSSSPSTKTTTRPKPGSQSTAQPIKGVKQVILVASGKGGVGKSTIAYHLAKTLNKEGHRVGLLDADVFGPSIPSLMEVNEKPDINEDNKMVPVSKDGIQTISMGYLVDPNKATVWRGPMVTKSLYQLFRGTAWDNVDYLVVDMPPGTGDVQLSIAQQYPVDGVVLVTTPQELAILDVRKAADMFRKVDISILGLIENMSYYEDPETGKQHAVFGKDGGKNLATELALPLLAQIPINGTSSLGKDVFTSVFELLPS